MNNGFTLVETLVTILVFTLIAGALFSGIYFLFQHYKYGWEQSRAVEEARRGVETMTREIREAGPGDDGSYPIEKAGDSEFIFYSDIDRDGQFERVRYFLGATDSKSLTKECVSYDKGGSCSVVFSDFLSGNLKSAEVKISIEGDFGWSREYASFSADGQSLGDGCRTGCSDCPGAWQGAVTFDVASQAADGIIELTAQTTNKVDPFCDWVEPNHSMKVKFELSWTEEIPGAENELRKGVIEPTSFPIEYPSSQEKISVLNSYVRNTAPIFEYYDASGNKIESYPARLSDTKLMKVSLIINVDPNHLPQDFQLESYVQPRNLKEEY
jgi:prepilin-type N-terminal cleavage/methylation domain-containing protein